MDDRFCDNESGSRFRNLLTAQRDPVPVPRLAYSKWRWDGHPGECRLNPFRVGLHLTDPPALFLFLKTAGAVYLVWLDVDLTLAGGAI